MGLPGEWLMIHKLCVKILTPASKDPILDDAYPQDYTRILLSWTDWAQRDVPYSINLLLRIIF